MKKNDTVVDLIRHIPFIRQDEDSEPYQIYEKTLAVDYNGGRFQRIASLDKPYPDVADPLVEITAFPSHVVTPAKTSGGRRDGYYIFLNTKRGTNFVLRFPGRSRAYGFIADRCQTPLVWFS